MSYYWTKSGQKFTVVYYDSEYKNGDIACQNATNSTSPRVVAKKINAFFGAEVVKAVAYGIQEIKI